MTISLSPGKLNVTLSQLRPDINRTAAAEAAAAALPVVKPLDIPTPLV
jgi:hypothetical protein